MPIPSLGRCVHYVAPNSSIAQAAIITRVIDDQHVNLTVFFDLGDTEPRAGVALRGYHGRDQGYWFWPPRVPDEREKAFAQVAPDAAREVETTITKAPAQEPSAEETFAKGSPDAMVDA